MKAYSQLLDLEEINENWTQLAPLLLDYHHTLAEPLWEETANQLKEFYLGENAEINSQNFLKFVQIFSDRFLVDVEAAIKWQAKSNKAPVYYYNFAFPGDHNTNDTVAHGQDGQYFFHKMFERKMSPNEAKMKDILLDMLISFVKRG